MLQSGGPRMKKIIELCPVCGGEMKDKDEEEYARDCCDGCLKEDWKNGHRKIKS